VDKKRLIGSIRTSFELHSFHGESWLVVKDGPDLRQLEPAAATLVQRGEVDGIRLVRKTDYLDHGFTSTVTILKRLRPGALENDPLMRANPGRDASWCDKPADMLGDVQRQVMRGLLARYLDERRLTPLEVLSYEVPAKQLDQAGTTVQGALQRLATQQVKGTKQTAVARMKELMAMVDEGLNRLMVAARNNPPPKLEPGRFGDFAERTAAAGGDPAPRLYRAVAAHLHDARTWLEKLDRLFRLWSPDLTVREMRVLDSMAAEILASPLALKELAGQERSRFDLVVSAIDLYVGNLGLGGETELPPGVKALSLLLAEGVLPRTLAELRQGVLRALHARLSLRGDKGLREEMKAVVEVLEHLRTRAPLLVRDEEVQEALAARADRLIQPEAMSDLLAGTRMNLNRIEIIMALVEEAPGEAPKTKLVPYLRPLIVPDDLIREQGGNRVESIKVLGDLARRISLSGMPPAARREMTDILDTALFDLLRQDVLANPSLSYTDRMLAIVRLCPGLPDGRARQLASDTLTQALRRPEFILHYLERFSGTVERREAYFKLIQALLDSGLVDRGMVPNAA